MEVAFHSAPCLSNSLQAVGFEMDVTQLSRGRLEGTFRLGGSGKLPVLSIQTNAETDPAQPGASRSQLPGGAADHWRQHRA
ncbi:transcriptional regulator/ AraC family [Synechococcus sp. A15-62]|nr:transcriptional regulator/ AraC family [Synechococcus sp. A15-62]